MSRRAAVRATVLAAAVAAATLTDAAIEATVEQPARSFGHVIGDVVTQRVLLQRDGRDFEPAALPGAGRIGAWLERRAPRIETDADGRRWLVVDHQLINAPDTLRTIRLPAWELKARAGGPALAVGEWQLSVAPLTTRWALASAGLPDLLPDRPAPTIATEPLRRRVAIWTGAALLVLAAWAGWVVRRNRRANAGQPFAHAWRELHSLDPASPQAWRVLHAAFDRTAGRVLQASTLPVLFERAPHLEAMRPQIEQFYARSQALFFGEDDAVPASSLRALCLALRLLEKRHEP